VKIALLAADKVIEEKEPNGSFREAQSAELGKTVRGKIQADLDVDVYQIQGQAGQQFHGEIMAARALSSFDPTVTLYDAKGVQLAQYDDARDSRDPQWDFKFPADGVYFLSLTDAHEKGGDWHSYDLVLSAPTTPISFSRDIAPIFRANCSACHKPGKTKGGLDLTTYEAMMKGDKNGPVVVPHDLAASSLADDISGAEPAMPKEGETLTEAETALVKAWILQGAANDALGPAIVRTPSQPPTYHTLPAIASLAWSPDGQLLAVPGHHEILLYTPNGDLAARLLGESPRLETVTFSHDGKTLAACGGLASEFGEIQLWDVAARKLQRSIKTARDTVYGVSFSADEQQVAVGCADKMVRVFATNDGRETMKCDNHIDWVFGTAFSQDGKQLATVSRDKAAKLIDISTGQLIDDINKPRDALICLTKHPTADMVATGGTEGKIRLFKMAARGGRLSEGDDKENSFVREFEHMATPLHCIAFSADGSSVACSGLSGEVRIFKTENGQRTATLKGEFGPTYALAFQPNTNLLAVGGQDGKIRCYDSSKGLIVKEFPAVPLVP
jgi:WD40 repeat protein